MLVTVSVPKGLRGGLIAGLIPEFLVLSTDFERDFDLLIDDRADLQLFLDFTDLPDLPDLPDFTLLPLLGLLAAILASKLFVLC